MDVKNIMSYNGIDLPVVTYIKDRKSYTEIDLSVIIDTKDMMS